MQFIQQFKVNVNGYDVHPVYTYLRAKFEGLIKWNFTKFLCVQGEPVARYEPSEPSPFPLSLQPKTQPNNPFSPSLCVLPGTNPLMIEPDIVAALDRLDQEASKAPSN